MIISASRRTDIPACYSRWLLQRMEQGYVLVRHPMRYHQISRVSLSPSIVDGMVFWTKNPTPMLPYLDALGAYPYYFQFTLTAYGQDMETNIPSKNDVVIPAFRRLADKIGPHRLVWRYDPIILTANYTVEYHVHYFREIAKRLAGYTQKCVISFVDFYRNTQAQLSDLQVMPMAEMQMS